MMWHALIYPHAELGGKFRSKSWAGMHVLDIAGVVVCLGGRGAVQPDCCAICWISVAPALVAGSRLHQPWSLALPSPVGGTQPVRVSNGRGDLQSCSRGRRVEVVV